MHVFFNIIMLCSPMLGTSYLGRYAHRSVALFNEYMGRYLRGIPAERRIRKYVNLHARTSMRFLLIAFIAICIEANNLLSSLFLCS